MSWWSNLFGKAKPTTATASPTPTTSRESGLPPPAASSTETGSVARDGDISRILWITKLPRYAHMAKHHELLGQYDEAEYNYNLLTEGTGQAYGAEHPDFATAMHELGRLNHRHVVEHAPEVQIIYNTVGRSSQIFVFYDTARRIREAALGRGHPAYGQSLWALATWYKDKQDPQHIETAAALLDQALAIQRSGADPLPTALSLACQGDLAELGGDPAAAEGYYREALQFTALDSSTLQSLDTAERHCRNAAEKGGNVELIGQARTLQTGLADPYFEMCFRLLESRPQELFPMVLELHRQQYRRDYLELRGYLLSELVSLLGEADGELASLRTEADLVEDLLGRVRTSRDGT